MPSNRYANCLSAALWHVSQGVGVVPMRPALRESGNGKPSPVPWIRWQAEGPLRRHREVEDFWTEHPDAQLAILLEKGLAAIDIDLKHLPTGGAPSGFPVPAPIPGGYVETTKSGGLHYLLRFREPLDPGKAERVTGLGGYVDAFHGGLLIVAPSNFEGASTLYAVIHPGGIPVFCTLRDGLAASAPWLAAAWEEKWARSKSSAAPLATCSGRPGTADAIPADRDEVERALAVIRVDAMVSRLFTHGARHPNGQVDRSMTEFRLVGFLKRAGFSRGATWEVVRRCPHTKSPRDPRGFARFDGQVWERLS